MRSGAVVGDAVGAIGGLEHGEVIPGGRCRRRRRVVAGELHRIRLRMGPGLRAEHAGGVGRDPARTRVREFQPVGREEPHVGIVGHGRGASTTAVITAPMAAPAPTAASTAVARAVADRRGGAPIIGAISAVDGARTGAAESRRATGGAAAPGDSENRGRLISHALGEILHGELHAREHRLERRQRNRVPEHDADGVETFVDAVKKLSGEIEGVLD